MKNCKITFAFCLWMTFTVILAISVIGLFVIAPQINSTSYYKSPSELRSTWMKIGYELKDKFLEN